MTASKAELHKARKAAYDAGLSWRAQGEILYHVVWFNLNAGYDRSDLELAFLKQLPSIWKNGTWDSTEAKKIISNTQYVDDVLGRAKKQDGETDRGTWILNYRDEEAIATEKELETTKASLKAWTDAFGTKTPTDIKGNQEKHTDADLEKHKPEDLKPADYDDLKNAIKGVYPNYPTILEEEKPENIKKYIKGLEDANTKLTTDKGTADTNLKEAIKAKEKAEGEAKTAKDQASQGQGASDKALNKLLTIYKEEITKRTQLFYQELNLDNNWINEKYGDSKVDYFKLLDKLTIDSEPEQVINAFRIVALIKATEKAQDTHNKYKDRLATLSPNLKINNRNKFNKIKDIWELITDEPTEANNPLYLPIIKDQGKYKQQLNDIINLWQ